MITFEGKHGEKHVHHPIPEDMKGAGRQVPCHHHDRKKLPKALGEELMNKYLEAGTLTKDEIKKALREGTIHSRIFPVLCGSSLQNMGSPARARCCRELPANSTRCCLSQKEQIQIQVQRKSADQTTTSLSPLWHSKLQPIHSSENSHSSVYSGVLKTGSYAYNASTGKKERIGRLVRLHANNRIEIEQIEAGDIGAAIGLKETRTGDTLYATKTSQSSWNPSPSLNRLFPLPSNLRPGRPERMGMALQKLSEEDPTFRVHTDDETGQTIIAGMGELHRISSWIVCAANSKWKAHPAIHRLPIANRSRRKSNTRRSVHQADRWSRSVRSRYLQALPKEPGKGTSSKTAWSEVVSHANSSHHVTRASGEGMSRGIPRRIPTRGHQSRTARWFVPRCGLSEMAYKICASIGLQAAARKADPTLLEPVMKVEVTCPEEYFGDVMGDLSSRRGLIKDTGNRGLAKTILAEVPLAAMFGYVGELRSMTPRSRQLLHGTKPLRQGAKERC